MRRGKYEILITAPDERFINRSLGVHGDFDSAMEDVRYYTRMGMKVNVFDQKRQEFIKLHNK